MSLNASTQVDATPKQISFIEALLEKRDHTGHLTAEVQVIANRVVINKDRDTETKLFVGKRDASKVIDALLACKPLPGGTTNSDAIAAKNALLAKLPLSMYALPRANDPETWDFFEVVERKSGRYLNQLLGSPSDWNRKYLPLALQSAAARAILSDPKSAAVAYAQRHGRCAVCNAHLSDPKSIEQSMGPVCAKRFK